MHQLPLFPDFAPDDRTRLARREPIRLDFEERQVRVVIKDGEPWWVASDLGRVLGYSGTGAVVRALPADEKGVHSLHTLGGNQEMAIVNEPGLYRLIINSRRPEAETFKRWVFHEVLPTIRKTGGYGLDRVAVYARRNRCDLPTAKIREDQRRANIEVAARQFSEGAGPYHLARWHNAGYLGQTGHNARQLCRALGRDRGRGKKNAPVLDSMGLTPLSGNMHAKAITTHLIAEAERAGRPMSLEEQAALLEAVARRMTIAALDQLGPGAQYGVVDDPKRGKIIDVVRPLPRPEDADPRGTFVDGPRRLGER